MLADHGWVRLLGGGSEGLPDLGGRFAVNGGGLPGQPREVCYWGPDTLAWTALGGGYSQFACMVLSGGLDGFFQDLRWPGWQEEAAALGPDQSISVYPFLFTAPKPRAADRPQPRSHRTRPKRTMGLPVSQRDESAA
jgi:hypothetical protein